MTSGAQLAAGSRALPPHRIVLIGGGVLLAAPTAVLGGCLVRPIALWLGAKRPKTLDGSWIVLSALYLLWLNAK